jgi:hypothetical protein
LNFVKWVLNWDCFVFSLLLFLFLLANQKQNWQLLHPNQHFLQFQPHILWKWFLTGVFSEEQDNSSDVSHSIVFLDSFVTFCSSLSFVSTFFCCFICRWQICIEWFVFSIFSSFFLLSSPFNLLVSSDSLANSIGTPTVFVAFHTFLSVEFSSV